MPNPAETPRAPETFTWLGFTFVKYGRSALVALFFAIAMAGVFIAESANASIFAKATSATAKKPGLPVYVTSRVVAPLLGSELVEPGAYLQIVQASEVYASRSNGPSATGAETKVDAWGLKLAAPNTAETRNGRVWSAKVVGAVATLSANGTSYELDFSDAEVGDSMHFRAPAATTLKKSGWEVIAQEGDHAVLYRTRACQSKPELGCERFTVRVLPLPEGEITAIGDLEDHKVVKFGDMNQQLVKVGTGNLKATLAEYSFESSSGWTMASLQCTFCFLVAWVALSNNQRMLRRLTGKVTFLRNSPSLALTGATAGLLTGVAVLLRGFAPAFALLVTVALLAASREPKSVSPSP